MQVELFKLVRGNRYRFPELRLVFAVPNGGHRFKATAVSMYQEGVEAGVWDVFVSVPTVYYHGLWIEMKAEGNGLTPDQKSFGEAVKKNGYATSVCYSSEAAWRRICSYLGIIP